MKNVQDICGMIKKPPQVSWQIFSQGVSALTSTTGRNNATRSSLRRQFFSSSLSGKLGEEIELLASRCYRHPYDGKWVTFGASTIERWYYRALHTADPVAALNRKVRSDRGETKAMSAQLVMALGQQYASYPHWSYMLHADNLTALVTERPELGDAPSYSTVRRRMKERGWLKKRLPKTAGQRNG